MFAVVSAKGAAFPHRGHDATSDAEGYWKAGHDGSHLGRPTGDTQSHKQKVERQDCLYARRLCRRQAGRRRQRRNRDVSLCGIQTEANNKHASETTPSQSKNKTPNSCP